MGSPYSFKRYGQSGLPVSEIFAKTAAAAADDLCVIRSMQAEVPNHEPSLMLMNCGEGQLPRPSFGAWVNYGLGTMNENLPGFVAISHPRSGKLWRSGFLPSEYQGTRFSPDETVPEKMIRYLKNPTQDKASQRQQLDLIQQLNGLHLADRSTDGFLEGRIRAMETAFRMQFAVPDVFDISKESKETRELYGNSEYAKGCLIARRLVERGVRSVQLSHSIDGYDIAWDTGHGYIRGGHARLAKACDQGIAALIQDLKRRGLLDETLVVWGGEFGRAPTSEGKKGRDHDHYGFTMFMAGGGVKPGFSYGATDNFGLTAVENRVHVHDLHATILHLMGLDHEKLTYRYSGRDYRLTDVHGKVIHDIIA